MSGTGIGYYRRLKGLTQLAIAQKLGIDDGTFARIENGQTIPTAAQIEQLVGILDVPPSHLFSKNILNEVADRVRAEAAS